MENALIVSCTEKSIEFFREMLNLASVKKITVAYSCAQARELLERNSYDFIIINSPLKDETGENLSRQTSRNGASQVILVVGAEYFEEVTAATDSAGVFTVSRPVSRSVFWSALRLAKSASKRLKIIQDENTRLRQKLEDTAVLNRAKLLLISYLGLTEQDAHKYIERRAMDSRATKRQISEDILKMYEN